MDRIAEFMRISRNETNDSFYDDIILPKRATSGSAGYDFFIPYDLKLKPGESTRVNTNIRCKIDKEYVLMVFPRSSLGFKYKLQLDNTVGIIDSDYFNASNEGHIMIAITNWSDKVLELKKGDRFAQGIFLKYGITIDDDTKEERTGGYGSTGK